MKGSEDLPEKLILYDGVCNLCDASIRFILPRDSKGVLRFASLQSELGRKVMMQNSIPITEVPESLIFVENGQPYFYSSGALRIAGSLDFPWSLAGLFLNIPRPIRDFFYRLIARNRYRWFGRKEGCLLPQPQWKSRFL
jgi:predicted DCC family thiol-disulfide oxidoreductase YuxK